MNDDTAMLELLLTDYFHAASPSDSFARTLELRLAAAHSDTYSDLQETRKSPIRLRLAVIGILVVLGIGLAIIGPDRVWAAVQQLWQRYIPGIGLVEETNALALAEPVSYTEAGVTFEVQEFVATQEDTRMRIVIRGLPLQGMPEDPVVSPESIIVESIDGKRLRWNTSSYGRVWPPCEAAECPEFEAEPPDYGLGYVLEALPLDTETVHVIWNVWGLVPGSDWSDRWVLEIPLSPLAETEIAATDQLIYSPDASLSIDDMTLTVASVVQAADRTVLDVTWSVPGWEAVAQPADMTLIDDQGRRYALFPGAMDLDEHSRDSIAISTESSESRRYLLNERWKFEPVAPDARTLTLKIETMYPRADAEGSFAFDLPDQPQEGDLVPIDQTFEIAGGMLRVASVRFVSGTVVIDSRDGPPASRDNQLLIETDLEVVEQPSGGRYESVILEAGWSGPGWMYPDPVYSESSGIMVMRLVYDPGRIWSKHVRIHFGEVTVYQQGDWALSWEVPPR